MNFGGSINFNQSTLVISYRYNCDATYNNCADKEAYFLTQRYGIVQWMHYVLRNGSYQPAQVATFNWMGNGSASPSFPCF